MSLFSVFSSVDGEVCIQESKEQISNAESEKWAAEMKRMSSKKKAAVESAEHVLLAGVDLGIWVNSM